MYTGLKRSLSLALLFKDLALLRIFGKSRRERRRRQITERLGLLHGLPQKIGQLLAFSELDSSSETFTALTENLPTMPFAEAAGAIDGELRNMGAASLAESFAEIATEGISASIGQVHRATLNDGRDVAIKIQYPGIADSLDHDLRSLGWLTAPVGDLRRGFDLAAYRNEIGAMLRRELDYTREARSTTGFGAEIASDPWLASHVETPEVINEYSNERLLTTTWLEGHRFTAVHSWSEADRHSVAKTLLRLFLRGCFDWRQLHADPHPGNYRFRRREGIPIVGLLDFGCLKQIPTPLADGLFDLITESPDEDRAREIHLQMGFHPELLQPLHGRLAELSRILFRPFAVDAPFDLNDWHIREEVSELLGEHRLNYRLAGPPEMIYLLRSFQGLLRYLKSLRTPLNWRRLLRNTKADRPADSSSVSPPTADATGSMLSDSLHISVSEHGRARVSLSFGAGAAANLEDLVPLDLKPKLESRGIQLAEIAFNACQNRFAPGELFQLDDGPKSVRVWLE